jgi:hypothetical protein
LFNVSESCKAYLNCQNYEVIKKSTEKCFKMVEEDEEKSFKMEEDEEKN